MVTDQQVRRLREYMQRSITKGAAASKAGMDEKTARKYHRLDKLPSEIKQAHGWRTRQDPFSEDWDWLQEQLETNPGLEAKTLFAEIQRQHPGRYADGQLRTLQRRIKVWRALEGPAKEVFFPQEYQPGDVCQSDFTRMNSLGITIQKEKNNHLIYHFVLPYSNWETGTVCYSESFESLSEGLQNALWELGGVPQSHQTDRLSAAVHKTTHPEEFTQRYQALLRHYGFEGKRIQVGQPNENGDVEQSHHRFKRAMEQALLLRGSRDFNTRQEYLQFVQKVFVQLNAGRQERFRQELEVLRRLPDRRLEACKRLTVRVGPASTIRVNHNVYSVASRLIGEEVEIRLYVEHLEVWYAQYCVERIPRLRGEARHAINYRHIIDWLVRKPGAFDHYRYREDLFPTHHFRVAYDLLKERHAPSAVKVYLSILHLAARHQEHLVDHALAQLMEREEPITLEQIKSLSQSCTTLTRPQDVMVAPVELTLYDSLLQSGGVIADAF